MPGTSAKDAFCASQIMKKYVLAICHQNSDTAPPASACPTIPYISFLRQTAAGMNSLSFPYHPPAFSLLAVSYQMCHMSLFDELSGNDIMAGKRSIGMLGGPKKLSIRG